MIAFPDIDPVAFTLGPLTVRWYALAYITGIALGGWVLVRRAARQVPAWTKDQVYDLLFYVTLGVILGGRLGYVLFYEFHKYLTHPLQILQTWKGGMSFHGGLLGVIIAVALVARSQGRRFWEVGDFIAPVVPIGLGLGRLANFVNGELWGAPTDLPWGVVFPTGGDQPRHPTQIYEAILEGLVLFAVLMWFSRRPRPVGSVAGLFLLLYGVFRFAVEFVREPDAQLGYLAWGWVTMGQVLTTPMILLGGYLLLRAARGGHLPEERQPEPEEPVEAA